MQNQQIEDVIKHPAQSSNLGMYRLIVSDGDHVSTVHTHPDMIAEKLVEAGRDYDHFYRGIIINDYVKNPVTARKCCNWILTLISLHPKTNAILHSIERQYTIKVTTMCG